MFLRRWKQCYVLLEMLSVFNRTDRLIHFLLFTSDKVHFPSHLQYLCRIGLFKKTRRPISHAWASVRPTNQGEGWFQRTNQILTYGQFQRANLGSRDGSSEPILSFRQCCGSMKFLYGSGCGSGSADPYIWLMDPEPSFFFSDLQDVKKKVFFLLSFFADYFSKVHLHHCSKIKDIKKSQNSRNQCFSYFFLLDYRRIRIQIRTVPYTNGSGSGRPKNIRIRKTAKGNDYDCLLELAVLWSSLVSTIRSLDALRFSTERENNTLDTFQPNKTAPVLQVEKNHFWYAFAPDPDPCLWYR